MEMLLAMLLGRRVGAQVPPPRAPESFRPRLPETDLEDEEITDDEEEESGGGHILGEALVIRYVNSKGEESARRIALHAAYLRNGVYYIRAYCFERGAPRCFRQDRIREIIDAATGEVISDFSGILEAVSERAEPLDAREATERAFKLQKHSIMALLFLARCDGQLHASEEGVLLRFIDEACGNKGVDEGYALKRLRRLAPDPYSYERALKYLARFGPPELGRILRHTRRLIEADGAITLEEARFALLLQECKVA